MILASSFRLGSTRLLVDNHDEEANNDDNKTCKEVCCCVLAKRVCHCATFHSEPSLAQLSWHL